VTVTTAVAATYFVQVILPGEQLFKDCWKPWVNCRPTDDIVALAAFRFARDFGLREGQSQEVIVCYYKAGGPLYPSGAPQSCQAVRCKVTGEREV
jgi:hypothetical protein